MAGVYQPPAKPTPPPPVPKLDSETLVRALVQALQNVKIDVPAAPAAHVNATPQVTVVPSDAPRQWKFSIKRNKDGLISEIAATAE